MTQRVLPSALEELSEAVSYYDQQRPGLGLEFMVAVEAAMAFAQSNPRAGERLVHLEPDNRIRRYAVDRFPHLLFVADELEERLVVAIAHAARRPGYWQDRLE